MVTLQLGIDDSPVREELAYRVQGAIEDGYEDVLPLGAQLAKNPSYLVIPQSCCPWMWGIALDWIDFEPFTGSRAAGHRLIRDIEIHYGHRGGISDE
jgi:hypothetical protein